MDDIRGTRHRPKSGFEIRRNMGEDKISAMGEKISFSERQRRELKKEENDQ